MMGMNEKGLTLIELLIAIAIMGIIAAAGTSLLSASLDTQMDADARARLYQEGMVIMERMVTRVQTCTYLLIPNAHKPTRNILAVSGFVNNDNDYYFGDPLFPRIDEDPGSDMTNDGRSGIGFIDDNGNGIVDGSAAGDDDEDGSIDEDKLDGIDNDGDGMIDEDLTNDATGDAVAGIKGMDDDGDGSVDEGNFKDDDEDGLFDEDGLDPLVYTLNSGTSTFTETLTTTGQTTALSNRVSGFQVTSGTTGWVLIELSLADSSGCTVAFSEYAFSRNVYQRTGKRVR